MRVTNKMLSDTFLSDMRTNLENLQTLQQQMSSGQLVSKPSDDPFASARIMQLNSDIDANKQYNENISDTSYWLQTTDTALNQAGNVLGRVKTLLTSAGNAGYSTQEMQAIKSEINEDVGQLSQILNTNFDGKYIFGGNRGAVKPTDTITDKSGNTEIGYYDEKAGKLISKPPVTQDEISQMGMIGAKLSTEISEGVSVNYNVTATDILSYTNSSGKSCDLRTVLQNIVNHLDGKNDDGDAADADATSKLIGQDLSDITDGMNNVLTVRADVGAMENRMESASTKNTEETDNFTAILSKTQDVDVTKETMEYYSAQTVYLASLQTASKIIQPSLIDYLK